MKKILKWLDDNLELTALILLLASIVVIMFYQIIRRYFMNSSLSWSEEYCRYAFIWFMFIATSYAVKLRSDLRVDAVIGMLPPKGRKIIDAIDVLICFAMVSFLFFVSFKTVANVIKTKDVSTGLHLPMKYVYAAMPAGFGLTVFRYIQRIIQDVKKMTGKETEKGADE